MNLDKNLRYPILEVNLDKLTQNTENIVKLCGQNNIFITGVVKGCNASIEISKIFLDHGCQSIGSSRIEQLISLRKKGIEADLMMLRLPMASEIADVVKYSNISLNSERTTLEQINSECTVLNTQHKVILMYDLGDLREGVWSTEEFINLAEYVETELSRVELYGIGTNLGCYGSVKTTEEKMQQLVQIAEMVEERIQRKLKVISGGTTFALPLVLDGKMPSRINHLRIGEGMLLSKDLQYFFGYNLDFMHKNAIKLIAQIIEIQDKPSFPDGELFVDSFGNFPQYNDKGRQKRALLAVGKQDFGDHNKLFPVDVSIEIIGSSSDHLIVDLSQSAKEYRVGDIVEFTLLYQSMLYLFLSASINKVLV